MRQGVNGLYSITSKPTITYHDIPPGRHVLRVRLANTDQTPAGPTAQVSFQTIGAPRTKPPHAKCFQRAAGQRRHAQGHA